MITEAEMRNQLASGYTFPPLRIRLASTNRSIGKVPGPDAILSVTTDECAFDFAAAFKTRSTPQIFEQSLSEIEHLGKQENLLPMLVVPYLRENQLAELQRRSLSGIDLSGNGVVSVPGKLLVYRAGAPNRYPESAPTKYAYRGVTSLVARAFLCKSTFPSLGDIENEIRIRGGGIAISTVSKALKRLESDLIIDRTPDIVRLRQPEKLLESLVSSYTPPKIRQTKTLKVKTAPTGSKSTSPAANRTQSIAHLLRNNRSPADQSRLVLSGLSSIGNYAVMGRQDWPVLYTNDISRLLNVWGSNVQETARFIDLELRETDDPTVYFDVRIKQQLPYASPIQVFLECSVGDKREQEAADQVKETILRDLKA